MLKLLKQLFLECKHDFICVVEYEPEIRPLVNWKNRYIICKKCNKGNKLL